MAEEEGMEAVTKHVDVLAERLRGQVRISVKGKTWERVEEDNRWAVMMKLTSVENFNIQGLAAVLKRAWRIPKAVRFMEVPGAMALVKFDSEDKMIRVFDGGPWTFDGAAVLIQKWVTGCKKDEMKFNKLRIWVQIHNVPEELLGDEVVEEIADVAGKVTKKMPPENDILRRRYERFQVEIDIHETLKPGCYVKGRNGNGVWIQFKYERVPNFCKHCGVVSHYTPKCPKGGLERNFGQWLKAESEERWMPEEEATAGVEEEDDGQRMNGQDELTVDQMWNICGIDENARSTLQGGTLEGIEVRIGTDQMGVTSEERRQNKGKETAENGVGKTTRYEVGEMMLMDRDVGPIRMGQDEVRSRLITAQDQGGQCTAERETKIKRKRPGKISSIKLNQRK